MRRGRDETRSRSMKRTQQKLAITNNKKKKRKKEKRRTRLRIHYMFKRTGFLQGQRGVSPEGEN